MQNVIVQADNADMWEAAELLSRLDALDTSPATIEALAQTAERLCCDYRWRSAVDLRDEAIGWLREALRLRGRASLRAHRDLLTIAGWFGALIGCLEYDMGWRTAADATRGATASLARESENAEILAWTYEMSAWFALTQNRFVDALDAAEAGRRIGGERGVTVQLHAQEARAFARLGDLRGVSVSLDQGRALLDRLNRPEHPENHFVVDPDKWDFYAMDAFRLVGDDHRADFHARAVIELGKAPDGTERSPMRMAEARITLGVVAARAGELEEAVEIGIAGFQAGRRSLPSLLLVAEELNSALLERNPPDRLRQEYRAALRAITSD